MDLAIIRALRSVMECPHCGGVACSADEHGEFTDGQGSETGCESCGFHGHVSCDGETEPYWCASELPSATCDRDDCEECGMYRREGTACSR